MKISLIQCLVAVIFTGVSLAHDASAQELLQKRISLKIENQEIRQVLSVIEKQAQVRFAYRPKYIPESHKITIKAANQTLAEVLERITPPLNLKYEVVGQQIILSPEQAKVVSPTGFLPRAITLPIDRQVAGNVTDENNVGLPGVSVVLKGTTRGTTTNADGRFELAVPELGSPVLVFSFVGYLSQEVAVGNQSSISVSLQTDTKSLEEVVVVGYGTVKKSDLTGSVAQVKSEEINQFPTANPLQALSGRAAGVQVTQNSGAPGAGISVRIRGTNSIQGSNEPLYVVDGFPISGSNPTVLNNADIESVEVLKDASATAIYGSRGANGVVIITTKQGKTGRTKVDFETSYSQQTLRKKLDLMNGREYATFYNQQAVNDRLAPYFTEDQVNAFGDGFDWQDLIFQKAPMKTTALNISGGNDKTQFSVSGSYFGQDGIIKGSDYNRYSLRTNINHQISKKFSLTLSNTLSRLKTDRRDSDGGSRGNSMISAALSAPPTLTPYNEDGSYRILAIAYPFVATDLINPLNFINEQSTQINANRILTNAALLFKPIPELTIKISGGIENADDRTDSYTTRNFFNSPGRASVSSYQFTSLLNENTISYNKTFNGLHSFSAVAGFTYQDFITKTLGGSGNGFLSDITETFDLGSSITPGIPSSGYSKSVLISYLSRVNYSFNDRYLLTASVRRDGSSRYSPGNKWGYFPSAAVAWKLSNEDFMANMSAISDLKLRASWGLTGSQAINAYATLNELNAGRTVFDDAMYNTFSPGTRLPGNLKWETTEQLDFGLDLGLLRNRLFVSADYYIKNTRDLLNTVILPSSLGFTSTIQNIGEVQNKGFELGLDSRLFTGDFKWNLNANISINRNKVVKLYEGNDILGGNVNVVVVNDISNILREDHPIGSFWGYMEEGYNEQGRITYKDLDENGSINQNDKTFIGNPNPRFIYGLNSSMSWKNFDLTLFVQGVQGNDLLNVSSIVNTIDHGFGLNMTRDVFLNSWTPENPNSKYPLISRNTNARISNRFIEDGSYLRLRNIQLAFNAPVEQWGIQWLRNTQVYVSGQNLLTLTNYSWWDPEVNTRGGANSTSQGIDHNSYPTAKSVTCGVRIGF